MSRSKRTQCSKQTDIGISRDILTPMKGVFVAAILGIGILAYLIGVRSGRNQEHQNQVGMSGALAATLEQQEKCAKQAEKIANNTPESIKLLLGASKQLPVGSSNHYNVQLNRCFVEIDIDDYPSTSRQLSDAFEGVVYGSFSWHVVEGKKYWEVPPSECWVNDASGKKQQCKSNEEFDALLKPYFTN
jgi:hypothetical protein